MMLIKYFSQYASKYEKVSSGHRTGKGQFSFQSQRKAMPKKFKLLNMLISHASKSMLRRLQHDVNHELSDVQLNFKKAEETEIKLPTSTGS